MIDSSPLALIKTFFKDSVAFLASVLALVAGSYYLAAIYFSERVNLMASITYLISAISFSVLTIISLCYVGSDAYKLCRKLRSKGMRYFCHSNNYTKFSGLYRNNFYLCSKCQASSKNSFYT